MSERPILVETALPSSEVTATLADLTRGEKADPRTGRIIATLPHKTKPCPGEMDDRGRHSAYCDLCDGTGAIVVRDDPRVKVYDLPDDSLEALHAAIAEDEAETDVGFDPLLGASIASIIHRDHVVTGSSGSGRSRQKNRKGGKAEGGNLDSARTELDGGLERGYRNTTQRRFRIAHLPHEIADWYGSHPTESPAVLRQLVHDLIAANRAREGGYEARRSARAAAKLPGREYDVFGLSQPEIEVLRLHPGAARRALTDYAVGKGAKIGTAAPKEGVAAAPEPEITSAQLDDAVQALADAIMADPEARAEIEAAR